MAAKPNAEPIAPISPPADSAPETDEREQPVDDTGEYIDPSLRA
jgi:hypothetical protein